jgi:hypothetical protein
LYIAVTDELTSTLLSLLWTQSRDGQMISTYALLLEVMVATDVFSSSLLR